ncbi:MAG: hypothetical protein MI740_16085 [Halanaerobiales bacterium]|nr:hypothetical protein [Halanaerobiales bacterium]
MDKEKNKVFGKKSFISVNTFFIYVSIFIILMWIIVFYSGVDSSLYIVCQIILTILYFSIFTSISERIEFTSKHCILDSAPFLKHKHDLMDLTIIIKHRRFIFLRFNEPLVKLPFYCLLLDNKEIDLFIKYITTRKDIHRVKM